METSDIIDSRCERLHFPWKKNIYSHYAVSSIESFREKKISINLDHEILKLQSICEEIYSKEHF